MMKYSVFLGIGLSLSLHGYAQGVRGEWDVTAYPEVSFVWNEYDPERKDTTRFLLTGDSGRIAFQLQHLPVPDTCVKERSILFLWEDLDHPAHEGQSEFTRALLYRFLQQVPARAGDRFNVAVFDRKGGNDMGASIHTLLADGFTSDRGHLAQAVRNFAPKYDFFSRQVNSELYMAMEEGIELLKKEPADRVRVLVVVTAGSNQDRYGGRGDFADVKAVELKIPVYLVKYPIAHCEHCTNIDQISKNTFGRQITTTDTTVAGKLLLTCFDEMNTRHHGQDYRVTFRSSYPRDGKLHAVTWSVNGKEYMLSYAAPSFSVAVWAKERWRILTLVGATFLVVVAGVTFFVVRGIKRKRHRREWTLESVRQEQQAADAKLRVLEKSIQEAKREQEIQAAKEQETELTRIMRAKNLYPRLQYARQDVGERFYIHHPVTTIGRDDDNMLILTDKSVSRHHAKVLFTGSDFEIQDLGSTNKVIVNGQFVQRVVLKNGDIIGLGEVVLYFYN
jgi:hypothetical protein